MQGCLNCSGEYMPDSVTFDYSDPLSRRFQRLDEFFAQRVPRASGKPYSEAGKRAIVTRLRIPIVKLGEVMYVDLERLADRLHERSDQPLRRTFKRKRRVKLYD